LGSACAGRFDFFFFFAGCWSVADAVASSLD
jgi:hypothetical protein